MKQQKKSALITYMVFMLLMATMVYGLMHISKGNKPEINNTAPVTTAQS